MEGATLKATCTAKPPGNPVGSLFWRWHFPPSPVSDHSLPRLPYPLVRGIGLSPFDTPDFVAAIAHTEDVPTNFYRTFQSNDQLSTELVLPNIGRRYHTANLSCETGHSTGVSLRKEYNLNVHRKSVLAFNDRNLKQEKVNPL